MNPISRLALWFLICEERFATFAISGATFMTRLEHSAGELMSFIIFLFPKVGATVQAIAVETIRVVVIVVGIVGAVEIDYCWGGRN